MLDIHTHHLPSVPGTAIVSVSPADFCPQPGHWYSTGIHPWQTGDPQWQADDWEQLLVQLLRHPQVLAVGEAGLDRLAQAPLPLQTDLFRRQALLAETVGKPLIIHAVKAQAELIALKRELQPAMPWVIHGFRGKPQMADAYLRHGFYLSFGQHYHPEALRLTPTDRLLLETDESLVPIGQLYQQAATLRQVDVDTLRQALAANVCQVFFGH